MVSTPNSQSIRLKRRTGEAWDFQQRIFIALKILNLFVILSGQKTLLACLCIPGPLELDSGAGGGGRGKGTQGPGGTLLPSPDFGSIRQIFLQKAFYFLSPSTRFSDSPSALLCMLDKDQKLLLYCCAALVHFYS